MRFSAPSPDDVFDEPQVKVFHAHKRNYLAKGWTYLVPDFEILRPLPGVG
jgi:hypothetical protein